jgi:hypothetical protein
MRHIVFLLVMGALLAACGGSEEPAPPPDTGQQTESDDSTAVARAASDALVARFMSDLKSELSSAVREKGAAGAISVCAETAPAVADSHSTDGWSIRRVSDKNRNPNNRATLAEQEILAQFAVADSSPAFVELWIDTDSGAVYHYYRPIRVQPLCLNCHGGIQTLAPGVMNAVRKHYPLDKAIGYRPGDLRGMFVVESFWREARESAVEMAEPRGVDK